MTFDFLILGLEALLGKIFNENHAKQKAKGELWSRRRKVVPHTGMLKILPCSAEIV